MPEMEAEGMTCMGEGLSLALDLLEKRKAKYKATGVDYYQPILVVMSDGLPNGNRRVWDEAVERIRALCASRKLSVVAVGIGMTQTWRCWPESARDSDRSDSTASGSASSSRG